MEGGNTSLLEPEAVKLGVDLKVNFNRSSSGGSVTMQQNGIHSEAQNPTRKEWANQVEFFLSMVGYAVGLGNVWRFPAIAYANGGGSFLIPYIVMVLFLGLPIFFLEIVIGQYSGKGPSHVYGRLAPAFKGLGFAMVLTSFLIMLYYNVVIAWSLFYMFAGLQSELPWASCINGTSSDRCHEGDITNNTLQAIPAEDYYYREMLGYNEKEHTWANYGSMRWQLVLCLAGSWTLISLCMIKGVRSAGKVVYFTALFPYVMLITLFVYAMTFDGAANGVLAFITPDFKVVGTSKVWKEAAIQIFYSLCGAMGGLTTLSSYNKFNNNCHRDALLITVINCATSIFAGLVAFAILGIMADVTGQDVKDVVKSGPGLVFQVYPFVISKMGVTPVPQIMSFLFFIMMVTLGIDSMMGLVETVTTCILDNVKPLRRYKELVVVCTCLISFLLGLTMCTEGGLLMFGLLADTTFDWNAFVLAIMEVALVAWLYGPNRFMKNIEEMGMKLSMPMKIYWKACWTVITPLILYELLKSKLLGTYNFGKDGVNEYNPNIQALGWMLSLAAILLLLAIGLYEAWKVVFQTKEGWLAMFQPTTEWRSHRESLQRSLSRQVSSNYGS